MMRGDKAKLLQSFLDKTIDYPSDWSIHIQGYLERALEVNYPDWSQIVNLYMAATEVLNE